MRPRATITRFAVGPQGDRDGTPGLTLSPSGLQLYTHELPWRADQKDVSCLPPGVYLVELLWSNAHGCKLFHLTKMLQADGSWGPLPDGRTAVELHVGNLSGDVAQGALSQVLGCVLIGNAFGTFPEGQPFKCADGQIRKLPKPQHGVIGSADALKRFMEDMGDDSFELEIVQSEKILS